MKKKTDSINIIDIFFWLCYGWCWCGYQCYRSYKKTFFQDILPNIFTSAYILKKVENDPSETGKTYIPNYARFVIYDIFSFIENCVLVSVAASLMTENIIPGWFEVRIYYIGVVIGAHVLAIMMKVIFYKELHPWIPLSKHYKVLTYCTYFIYAVFGLFVLCAPLAFGIHYEKTTLIVIGGCIVALIPLILPYFVIHCYKQGPQPPLNDTEAQTQNLEDEEEKPFINQDGDNMELQEIATKNENVSRRSLNSTSAIIVQPTSTETKLSN
jgi:hypothetical protein